MKIIFHRLIQRDIHSALDYYEREGGCILGDRFFAEVEATIIRIEQNPKGHHFSSGGLRRASLGAYGEHL